MPQGSTVPYYELTLSLLLETKLVTCTPPFRSNPSAITQSHQQSLSRSLPDCSDPHAITSPIAIDTQRPPSYILQLLPS